MKPEVPGSYEEVLKAEILEQITHRATRLAHQLFKKIRHFHSERSFELPDENMTTYNSFYVFIFGTANEFNTDVATHNIARIVFNYLSTQDFQDVLSGQNNKTIDFGTLDTNMEEFFFAGLNSIDASHSAIAQALLGLPSKNRLH
jgi:hypothetical protein